MTSEAINESSSQITVRERSLLSRILEQREFSVTIAIIGLFVLGALVRSDVFLTINNVLSLVRNAAAVSIAGYGMSYLMTSGEFDLSIGSMSALAAGLTAVMISDGYAMGFTLIAVLVFATIFGLTQGLVITKLGLPSLIITIGSLTLLRGVHFVVTGSQSQTISTAGINLISLIGGVITLPVLSIEFPMQIVWVFLLLAVLHYVLFHTTFGYHTRFTGGNTDAASYTGIDVDGVKIVNFGLVALLAAFAGISRMAWSGSVSPQTGSGFELIVIAAVVIGGTDLFGGKGTIYGVVLGSLVFSLTQNILVLAGFGAQLFQIFTGIFIISAVLIERVATMSFRTILRERYLRPVIALARTPGPYFRASVDESSDISIPLMFLTVNWIVGSLLTISGIYLVSGLGESFSIGFIGAGLGSFVTVPVALFFVIALGLLLVVPALFAGGRLVNRTISVEDATIIASYSFAPVVLFFLPVLLAGLSFLTPIVGIAALMIVIPSIVLLSIGVNASFDLTRRESAVVLGTVAITAAVILMYLYSNLAPA